MKRNAVADNYLKSVKRELVCPKSLRKRSLDQLKTSLDEFLEDHPTATEADIVEQFGSPADFANAFLASLDEGELKKQLKKSKRIFLIVAITCVAIVLIWLAAVAIIVAVNSNNEPTYIGEIIVDGPTWYEESAAPTTLPSGEYDPTSEMSIALSDFPLYDNP